MIRNFTVVLACSITFLAVDTTCLRAAELSDEERMQSVEEMFSSPYQEEDYYRADRMLVTATGNLKPVRKAPSVATIITAEDIEKMGAKTLSEALESVPGLHVQPSGYNRFTPIFSIRGIHTSFNPHTLLLINGVPFRESFNSSLPPTFKMATSLISRIEIVRGPVSAIYGADAFSGVINVITKEGQEIDGIKGGTRAGSFDSYEGFAQYGKKYSSGLDVVTGFDYMKSQGDDDRYIDQDAYGSQGALDTRYENYDGLLGVMHKYFSVRFYGNQQKDNAMGPGAQYLSDNNRQNNESYLGDINLGTRDLIDDLELTLNINGTYSKTEAYWQITPPAFGNSIGNPSGTSRSGGAELIALYSGINNHSLRVSTGMKNEDLETDENKNFDSQSFASVPWRNVKNDSSQLFCDDQSRNVFFLSLQDEWIISRALEFTGGVRYDNYSDFGDTFNPRAALVWEARYDLILKLLYGRAFRAPSFGELHTNYNTLAKGNSELEPETIETIEWVMDYQPTSRLRSVLNLFYYEIENLIEYDKDQTPPTSENNRDQDGYGFELETEWDVTDTLTLRTDFAYQRSKDKATNSIVADAPAMQFHLNPHWAFLPEWSIDMQFYWIADRHRASTDTRPEINDYQLVHLTLTRKNILNQMDFSLSGRNIFDEDARIPSDGSVPNDYPQEGRSIYGELRLNF
ncbi:MAG: TonB-dependent receptor [Proteobacteria bacterium]|nr:TonB-dependent receptor [Pseudomonadota bacterium]